MGREGDPAGDFRDLELVGLLVSVLGDNDRDGKLSEETINWERRIERLGSEGGQGARIGKGTLDLI